jgi:hypothetical protein
MARPADLWSNVIPIDLVLLAGLLAYLAYATGGNGPIAVTGFDDANRIAGKAWFQIPAHLVVAGLLATRWPVIRLIGGILLVTLTLWMAVLTLGVIMAMGPVHGTDLVDLAIVLLLLVCYGAATYLTFRSVLQPERLTDADPPGQVT